MSKMIKFNVLLSVDGKKQLVEAQANTEELRKKLDGAQKSVRTTADSVSELENDYATSEARINPDGTLYHDLKTKPQEIPKEVETPMERNDSIVYKYKDRTVYETVEVEVERELTWWQKTQMYGFWVALAVIVVGVIVSQRKKIISWLMKKII